MRDYFVTIIIPADTREMLEEEAENYRQKNEELNPKLKIYTGEINPNPEEVAFTKGDFQIFEVHYEYELR